MGKQKESGEQEDSLGIRITGFIAFVVLVAPSVVLFHFLKCLAVALKSAAAKAAKDIGRVIVSGLKQRWHKLRGTKEATPESKALMLLAPQPKEQSAEKPTIIREERDNVIVFRKG
jgi:hypothetical protein